MNCNPAQIAARRLDQIGRFAKGSRAIWQTADIPRPFAEPLADLMRRRRCEDRHDRGSRRTEGTAKNRIVCHDRLRFLLDGPPDRRPCRTVGSDDCQAACLPPCPFYRSGALGEIRTPDPRNRNPMLYPAELRAHWSTPTVGLAKRSARPPVFAFGCEFFNSRGRGGAGLAAQSGFVAGFLAGALLGGALHGPQIAVGGVFGRDLDPAGGGGSEERRCFSRPTGSGPWWPCSRPWPPSPCICRAVSWRRPSGSCCFFRDRSDQHVQICFSHSSTFINSHTRDSATPTALRRSSVEIENRTAHGLSARRPRAPAAVGRAGGGPPVRIRPENRAKSPVWD